MSETIASSDTKSRILSLAAEGKISEVESTWVDLVDSPPQDIEFYNELIKALTKYKARQSSHNLIALLLNERAKKGDWKFVNRILNAICGVWPDSEELKTLVVPTLRGVYPNNPNVEKFITASKINDGAPVDQGLRRFRSLMRLSPGQVYQHSTWGEGLVKSLDLNGKKITIDFPTEKGKVLTFDGVQSFLKYLPPNHFLARRAKEPKKLVALAEEKPVEIIRMVLESQGGKLKQAELKNLLLNSVIPQSDWTSWWAKARNELRLDPMIDFDPKGGAHAEITIRSRPKSFEEEIADLFFAGNLSDQIEGVQRLLKEQKSVKPQPELLTKMLKRLNEDYRIAQPLTPAMKLEFSFLADDIRRLGSLKETAPSPIPSVQDSIQDIENYEMLSEIGSIDYAMRSVKMLIERDGKTGVEEALRLLPHAPSRLAQAIWKEMDQEHHLDAAVKAMEILFNHPVENPETYLWSIKAILEGGWNHLEEYFPISRMVPELLDGLEEWHDVVENPKEGKKVQTAAKQLGTKVRALLQANHFEAICKASETMTLDQALRMRRSIQVNRAVNDLFKSAADRQLILTRKDLEKAPAVPAEAEFHYCTAKARAEKLKELSNLNGVEIPDNSKEIEEARQEGDLRENAGYHAAKDKQKMLMQKSLQLQQYITSARIFTTQQVRTDSIGFGVRFEAENLKSKETEDYIILGRWEANPDRHILSYLAPMVQQFLDKKAGDEITVKHPGGGETPYRVLSISNALESGEWDVVEEEIS